MAETNSRQALMAPLGLMSALGQLFPDFPDECLREDVQAGEASLHTVMTDFGSTFDAASSDEAQLRGLAEIVSECVREIDVLENAVGTCFLEHLRQRDRRSIFRKYLSPEVKTYMRTYC